MLFQWDEVKNQKNIDKHDISFEDARYVFADPFSISRDDDHEEEHRSQIIGHLGSHMVVLVIYTMRTKNGEDVIRIISARRATKQEKRSYERGTWV